MARGDHLFVRRSILGDDDGEHLLSFTHHGIDMGDNTIIHFASLSNTKSKEGTKIIRTTMRDFAGKQREVHILDYELLDIHTDHPDIIIKRAESKLGATGYDLSENNCEHFAFWCRTGIFNSYQIERLRNSTLPTLGLSVAAWYLPFLLPFIGYSKKYTTISVD